MATALKVATQASRALAPSHGSTEACAARPVHSNEQVLVEQRPVEAVDHHGGVDVPEEARLDQAPLAAAALLGGRADHQDAPGGQAVARGQERGARAGARRRDDVVAARVTDPRQRVVLAQDRQGGPGAGLEARPEGGGHATHGRLHVEALRAEEPAEAVGGVGLLEGQLGMRVDVERQRGELVAQPVHRVRDALLEGLHGGTTIP